MRVYVEGDISNWADVSFYDADTGLQVTARAAQLTIEVNEITKVDLDFGNGTMERADVVAKPTGPLPFAVSATANRLEEVGANLRKQMFKQHLDDRIRREHAIDDGVFYEEDECPDCGGTGEYQGFVEVDVCKRCRGTGTA